MVNLITVAGLANRMRAMASAITLAQEFNTELKVIWPMNHALNCRFDQLFDPIDHVEVCSTHSPMWRISGRIAKFRYDNVFFPVNMEDNQKLFDCMEQGKDIYINTNSQFYEVGHYEPFHPIASIVERSDRLLQAGKKDIVGIHIRRTDNAKSIAMSPTELFINAIEQEIDRNPETMFYLATDSRDDEKVLRNIFGNRIVVNSERDLRRYSKAGIQDALVDLICLSRCSHIIGSYWSSFSETAALMGTKKELRIVVKR